MKRCPSCQRTYEDSQAFCMNDGTPLVPDAAPPSLDKTMMSGAMSAPPMLPQQSFSQGTPQGEWGTPSLPTNPTWSQQPGSATTPSAPKKSKLPLILGGIAVLLLGLVGIGGGAAYFLLRKSSDENSNRKSGLGFNINKNDKESNANSSSSSSTSSSNTSEDSHSNMNMSGSSSSDVPTDKAVVLKQLYDLEYAWCAADLKGDKTAMDKILAPEFVVTNNDGTKQTKQQYMSAMKVDQYFRTCSYTDFSLGQSANYAVIIGYNTVKGRDANGAFTEKYKFTDTFVWRDGRWQATDSKSQLLK
ncbi:MAG: nuclear transport factor 2 family protein [Acidobacteria bacterium]|nr:nuclear transport factor 2 family protein [Acidobacteriota bacterium]